MAADKHTERVNLPPIPAKRYFTIGEVSDLCAVKPHVLRYWEQEFTQLKPVKRRGNRRYYQHHEVLLIRRIRELLYEQGFTINGARNRLDELRHGVSAEPVEATMPEVDTQATMVTSGVVMALPQKRTGGILRSRPPIVQPAIFDRSVGRSQPRCIQTDLVWVTVVSVSRHLSRPMPDCLKPPQIDVMSPWSKQLTQTTPASMSRAALWATETSEVQMLAARP